MILYRPRLTDSLRTFRKPLSRSLSSITREKISASLSSLSSSSVPRNGEAKTEEEVFGGSSVEEAIRSKTSQRTLVYSYSRHLNS